LRHIGWRVHQRCSPRCLYWDRKGYGRGTTIADPDENFAALINCQPLALAEFDLHILQECVIELKLALEGVAGTSWFGLDSASKTRKVGSCETRP
jgi:hypothetical protein